MSKDFIIHLHAVVLALMFAFSLGLVLVAGLSARQGKWRSLLNKRDAKLTAILTLEVFAVLIACSAALCLLNQAVKDDQTRKTPLQEQHIAPAVPLCDRVS